MISGILNIGYRYNTNDAVTHLQILKSLLQSFLVPGHDGHMGASFSEQYGKFKAKTGRPSSNIAMLCIVQHYIRKHSRGHTFPFGFHLCFENRGMIMTGGSKTRKTVKIWESESCDIIEWLCQAR